MYKQSPNYDVLNKRAELQKERYETRLQLLNQQIDELQKTVRNQQDIIGKLNSELRYKNTLIERMNNYANIPIVKESTESKQPFYKRIFRKNKS